MTRVLLAQVSMEVMEQDIDSRSLVHAALIDVAWPANVSISNFWMDLQCQLVMHPRSVAHEFLTFTCARRYALGTCHPVKMVKIVCAGCL